MSSQRRRINRRPNRRFQEAGQQATTCVVERLEDRRLLTRVMSGQVFEFRDVNTNAGTAGDIVRVVVTGPDGAFVDLVGATLVQAPFGSAEDMSDGVADAQF